MNGIIFNLQPEVLWTIIALLGAWLLAVCAALISRHQLRQLQALHNQRQSSLQSRYRQLFHSHALKLLESKKLNHHLQNQIAHLKSEHQTVVARNQWTHQLLTNMSHEIRTPLNAIIGFTELMLTASDKNVLENLRHIQSAGNHLMNLINDILDLSHLDSEEFTFHITEFALDKLIDECHHMMTPHIHHSEVEIQSVLHESAYCLLKFDRTRLAQIMINLLANAVKYTPSGSISLSVRIKQQHEVWSLELVVSDTGVGMTDEQIARILKPHTIFHQGDNRLQHNELKSTGLGMAIIDQLIRHLDGAIQIHSTPNVGTDIKITLPIKQPKLLTHVETQIVSDDAQIQIAEQTMNYPVIKSPDAPVLLVDDQKENLTLAECFMNKLGISFVSCNSGIEALNRFRETEFSYVFMDIRMPLMNGLETIKLMQQIQARPCVYVAVSANAMSSDIEHARNAGFDEYLTKPLSLLQLTEIFASSNALNVAEPTGIYWPSALEVTGQDQSLAITMIAQLIDCIPDMMASLRSGKTHLNYDTEVLHQWQGLTSYTGTVRLKRLLQLLEKAVKEANTSMIRITASELMQELRLVKAQGLTAINKVANQPSAITVATA